MYYILIFNNLLKNTYILILTLNFSLLKYRPIISWRLQTGRNSNLERKEYLLLCTKRISPATSPILCADLPRLGARALIIIMRLSRLFLVQNSGMFDVFVPQCSKKTGTLPYFVLGAKITPPLSLF